MGGRQLTSMRRGGRSSAPSHSLPSLHRITTLEALRAASDDQRHRILSLLITQPLAARAIATHLRMPRTKVYYHLNVLERFGLIHPVEDRIVGRRLERVYRAVARVFKVDTELIGSDLEHGHSEARRRILESALEDFRKAGSLGRTARDGDPTLVARTSVRLNAEQLSELRKTLWRLVDSLDTTQPDGMQMDLAVALFPSPKAPKLKRS